MATENIREKIAMLEGVIRTDDVQMLQHQCIVEAASVSTGDKQVDQQLMAPSAQQSQAQVLAMSRRLAVYRAHLASLQTELAAATAAAPPPAPAPGVAAPAPAETAPA